MDIQTFTDTWAVVELLGHITLAGRISKTELLGAAMLRIEVPATRDTPAFTRDVGLSSIYGITYVSEEVARATAQAIAAKPVTAYVPELDDYSRLLAENKRLKGVVRQLTDGLPERSTRAIVAEEILPAER